MENLHLCMFNCKVLSNQSQQGKASPAHTFTELSRSNRSLTCFLWNVNDNGKLHVLGKTNNSFIFLSLCAHAPFVQYINLLNAHSCPQCSYNTIFIKLCTVGRISDDYFK